MKSSQTKIIDYIKKIILYLDYSLWAIFDFSKFNKIKKKYIKKILIINLGAIGELIISTPLFPVLKKELNCEIDIMVEKGKENIFKNNPHISKVIIYKKNILKNIKNLKKENYDLAVLIFPVSTKMSLICKFSKIKYIIGNFGSVKSGPAFFFNKRLFPKFGKHAVEETLDIIRKIGVDNKNPKLEFYYSKNDEIKPNKFIRDNQIKNYVIIHPGFGFFNKNSYPSRLWPVERYAKIIDYIIKKYKIKIILTGYGKNEEELINKIINKTKSKENIYNASSLFSISEEAVLIKKSRLVISPSTSTEHFASCFNTPCICFMGVHSPDEWKPYMDKEKYKVLYHNEVCTECNQMTCRKKSIECMKAITTNEVKKAIDELLNKN